MSKNNFISELPPWAKGFLVIAGVAGVSLAIYGIYKVAQNQKNLQGAKKEIDAVSQTTKALSNSGQKPTLDALKLQQAANSIHSALSGLMSDESAVYRAFTNVNNDLDVVNLIKAYGVRKLSSGAYNPVPDFEGTLSQSLTEELNSSEIAALNGILARKGIKYRF